MGTQMVHQPAQKSDEATTNLLCAHQRMIDDVRTRSGSRTGKVRCLECGTVFDDPYQGSK